MTDYQNGRCHEIIHWAAAEAGAVGAGLAQIPLSDTLIITPIQMKMVHDIGKVFGKKNLSDTAVKAILSAAAASVAGRSMSQVLLGWIPFLGNGINATTAATVTEAIGWWAANSFDKELQEQIKQQN